jgi:hypothetical protein
MRKEGRKRSGNKEFSSFLLPPPLVVLQKQGGEGE